MNKELVDYIRQQTDIKVSKNKITDILLQQGWHQSEIDEAFLGVDGAIAPAAEGFSSAEDGLGDANWPVAGSKRKMILPIAIGLAVVAAIVGIIILPSLKTNNDNRSGEVVAPVETAAAGAAKPATDDLAANSEQDQTAGQGQTDPAVLAAIEKMATTITPPAGWIKRLGVVSSRPLVAFFKPAVEKDDSGKEIFNENISITRDSLQSVGVVDAAGYIAKSKTALQSKIGDYKILSERKITLTNGAAATLIGGSYTQNGVELKNMQMFVFNADAVYVITGVTLARNWDSEKDMIGAAVVSFTSPAD